MESLRRKISHWGSWNFSDRHSIECTSPMSAISLVRPAVKRILRSFEQRANVQQLCIAAKPSHQLQSDRQAVGTEAAGNAHRRMSGHVERHGPGKPVRTNLVEHLIVDFDGAEQVLLDR